MLLFTGEDRLVGDALDAADVDTDADTELLELKLVLMDGLFDTMGMDPAVVVVVVVMAGTLLPCRLSDDADNTSCACACAMLFILPPLPVVWLVLCLPLLLLPVVAAK